MLVALSLAAFPKEKLLTGRAEDSLWASCSFCCLFPGVWIFNNLHSTHTVLDTGWHHPFQCWLLLSCEEMQLSWEVQGHGWRNLFHLYWLKLSFLEAQQQCGRATLTKHKWDSLLSKMGEFQFWGGGQMGRKLLYYINCRHTFSCICFKEGVWDEKMERIVWLDESSTPQANLHPTVQVTNVKEKNSWP